MVNCITFVIRYSHPYTASISVSHYLGRSIQSKVMSDEVVPYYPQISHKFQLCRKLYSWTSDITILISRIHSLAIRHIYSPSSWYYSGFWLKW